MTEAHYDVTTIEMGFQLN